MHYSDYLQLEKILGAQQPESDREGQPAHDEMLFIVIHQAYELWFRQLLFETDSVIGILGRPTLNDNSPELQTIVHRLSRCATILKVLVHQIDIMETMTPMDFLDFRDKLRPASGFQSWQFKMLEAKLGLKYEHRYGQEYYLSQLRQPEIDRIRSAEEGASLLQLLNGWLERMPFPPGEMAGSFWEDYRGRYQQSLTGPEKGNLAYFDAVLGGTGGAEGRSLSPAACRAAVFIMLYRGYPLLQLPFQMLHQLLEIDEQLKHLALPAHEHGPPDDRRPDRHRRQYRQRLSGRGFQRHHLFKEIAALTSFLIERKRLPALSQEMERRLGFWLPEENTGG